MNKGSFNRSIADAYKFLKNMGLARACLNTNSLPVSDEFNRASLKGTPSHDDLFFKGLELRHYNFLMSDYSFLQFSLTSEGPEEELRLAYYANPMSDNSDNQPTNPHEDIVELEEMFTQGDIDFEEFTQALSENTVNISSPIIRYDVSFNQFQQIKHPISHLHLGINNSSRVATNRIFTPKFFTMFIVRTFYYHYWNLSQDEHELDIVFSNEKNKLNLLTGDNFCHTQKGLLNFV